MIEITVKYAVAAAANSQMLMRKYLKGYTTWIYDIGVGGGGASAKTYRNIIIFVLIGRRTFIVIIA